MVVYFLKNIFVSIGAEFHRAMAAVPGRFVPMQFRSRERNDHIVDVSFSATKLPSNFRSHELSSPTTVALLGRKPTRYSMHHCELFNYDYRVRLK